MYTQSRADYVVDVMLDARARRQRIGGFRITQRAAALRHFTASFEPAYAFGG